MLPSTIIPTFSIQSCQKMRRSLAILHILAFASTQAFKRSVAHSLYRGSRLHNSNAVPSAESITPATYRSDLYGVLGVPRNASREELKKAYWNIVSYNHPDRNNSEEALWFYQNASYAYNILGRDSKKRSEYDMKLEADDFIVSLGEVGKGVTELAVPLINRTFTTAIPLMRDVLDLGSAAVDAISEDTILDDSNSSGFFNRIAKAIGVKGSEQSIRRKKEQLEAIERQLNVTRTEMIVAAESDKIASNEYSVVNRLFMSKKDEYDRVLAQFNSADNLYSIAKREESDARAQLKRKDEEVSSLTKKASSLGQGIESLENEIRDLESLLIKKKQQLSSMQTEKSMLSEYLEANVSVSEIFKGTLSNAILLREEREAAVSDLDSRLRAEQQRLDAATRENNAAEDNYRRQRELLVSLTRRAEQLFGKKLTLESAIENETTTLMNSRAELEAERQRVLELRKKQEEEAALTAEMARVQEIRERMERRAKELEQIELERRRLEKEAMEEMEALRRSEEALKIRKKNPE